jgi:hypothetical protein
MPPRRSTRLAAVVERATCVLSPLPPALVLHIFSLLAVDDRMRCLEVCKAWNALFVDATLWRRLDLSPASGMSDLQANAYLLRAAAWRAGGALEALDVSCRPHIHPIALHGVLQENEASLRELRLHVAPGVPPQHDCQVRAARLHCAARCGCTSLPQP